jgi:amino acid adenylation domain-containing protein
MKELLKIIRDNNILLQVEEGSLKVYAGEAGIQPGLLAEIKERKAELLQLLMENDQAITADPYTQYIPVAPIQENYPLSSAQRRLWLVSQAEAGSFAYHMKKLYELEGAMNEAAFEQAFEQLITRHESLRTIFKENEDGEIRQWVLPPTASGCTLVCKDLRGTLQQDDILRELVRQQQEAPFDLSVGPLIRASLFRMADNKWLFGFVMHHIICDGWSLNVIVKDLLQLYEYCLTGKDHNLPPLRIQYKDHAVWQHQQVVAGAMQHHEQYWRRQLGGELPALLLPADKTRPAIRSYRGGMVDTLLDPDRVQQLKDLLVREGSTLFIGVVALVNCLLNRYTGQPDLITGSPVAGREQVELEDQVGLYLNALAIRVGLAPGNSFRELLHKVRQTVFEAWEHKDYPFDSLAAALENRREAGRNIIFDVFIDLHDGIGENQPLQFGNLTAIPFAEREHTVSKFDLTFMFLQHEGGVSLHLEYNSDLYERATAMRILHHFTGLLQAAVANPDQPVAKLNYLPVEEREQVLAFGTSASQALSWRAPVALIEAQVAAKPNNPAVLYSGISITYKELNEKANQLSHHLITVYGVQISEPVGILLDRSEYMIVAILAILKSGAAYVPIDPEYPGNRKAYILQDTSLRLLITQTDYLLRLDNYTGNVFAIDVELATLATPLISPGIETVPEDLAYVIYTSGSTGNPKGCCITHGSLSNYIQWANDYYFGNKEIAGFALFTSLSFDLTVTSIYCTLSLGGLLTVYDQHKKVEAVLEESFGAGSSADSIKLTPSHINILKQLDLSSCAIRCAVVGGEEVTPDHINTLKKINPSMRIYNEYGPTEATVGCIVAPLEQNEPVLIGKPVDGATIYILDEAGEICPIGIPGEICIGGAGLAREYLNSPGLTSKKFVPDPFVTGKRMYRTGDLAKWLPDGNIKFIGRTDDQVKIKGYRIEPGEIEQVLRSYEGIEAATVQVQTNKHAEKELVAYIASRHQLSVDDLKEHLSTALPLWMVPAHFVLLNELPLTAHGKIDKRKLPAVNEADLPAGIPFIAPRTATEEKLLQVLQEVTGRDSIGIQHNFFAIGGDSIRAVTFVVNARKQAGLKIEVNTLYAHPTVAELAAFLDKNANNDRNDLDAYLKAGYEEIAAVRSLIEQENLGNKKLPDGYEDIYPVVPIEQGMIFSSLMNPREPVYYDQFSFIVRIADVELFKEGLNRLLHRHPILRTRYYLRSFSRPVKIVMQQMELPLTMEDLSGLPGEEKVKRIRKYVEDDLQLRLTFDDEILWRINLFRIGDNRYYVTYSFHHAMLDGWSVSVIKTEIANYSGTEWPSLKHSYKDYCALSLGRQLAPGTETWWKNLLQGYTRNKLPFNYKGVRIKEAYGMKKVQQTIEGKLLQQLNRLAADHEVSFKAICLAAHVCLMHIICGEKDVVTGVVTHERPGIEDGENILGCFLTTVPVRINFDQSTTLLSLLKQVNEYLLAVKPHEVHLSDIARFIGDKTSFGNPVFDTILNYTDFHRFEEVNENSLIDLLEAGQNVSDLEVSHEMTNTLFDVEVGKTLDKFTARIKYTPAYFNEEDVQYALALYIRILGAFAQHVHTPVASLNLLSPQELKEVLTDFNDTYLPYEKEMTLDKLFEAQVKKAPGAIALKQDGITLSYNELNERANQLTAYLLSKGVKAGDNIGLHVSRSFNMIIGMFGILKAGAAYVPIDPEYPADRQDYIIRNSGVTTVVADTPFGAGGVADGITIITMSDEQLSMFDKADHGIQHSSHDLAYTIYTSGSTGRPKGVMIEHHSVINLIEWVNETFAVGTNDRLLFITSMCFDLSVYDIFGMLAAGGTIIIGRNEEVQQVEKLKKLLKEERITFWDSVPTTMNYLIGELEAGKADFIQHDLRLVFLSGDWIPVHLPDRIRSWFPQAKVISLGGATEGTVWSNYYPVDTIQPEWSSIPYGKPIKNNTFYILNDNGQPVPKGVAGELYIGGAGVARGYANDPEKTAASFRPDPFYVHANAMMYKTGDLGRMMPDGNMEFLGRKDNQVKIRGFRVELGEIESVLQRHEKIKGAIVDVYRGANDLNQLCAYLIPEQECNITEIKEYLAGRLPAYMVPASYMVLTSFPLNSNGKINRKALPKPAENGNNILAHYIPPVTATQIAVTEIWKAVLNLQRISIQDDLFELGANSLSVGAFVNRVQRDLDLVLNIREVFTRPTIEAIAAEIEKIKWTNGELFNADNTGDTENFSI